MRTRSCASIAAVLACAAPARADDGRDGDGRADQDSRGPAGDAHAAPPRRRDASAAQIFGGPFRSPRLFAMPVADVVGAYQLSLSGDASLLQEPGLLTAAGVAAIGFGDVAQLEYRHTSAIGLGRVEAPLPAVGVQLQAPFAERPWRPSVAIAFRLGVPRRETVADHAIDEAVTDLYLVGRLRLRGPLAGVTLHGGTRFSSAKAERVDAAADGRAQRLLILPALGLELAAARDARMIGEVGLAPQFRFDPARDAAPRIDYGLLGRLGVRWAARPAVVLDASIGYQLEVARSRPADGLDAIVQWDIRLGGEVFVPWGAIACRVAGAFCD